MNFHLTVEQEALRNEVRRFLDANVPDDFPECHIIPEEGTDEEWEFGVHICKKLAEKGWYTAHWPVEWGGLPLTPVDRQILWDEVAYRGVHTVNGIGMLVAGLI